MEIYMVGVHKNAKGIAGFRLLSIGQNGNLQIKDVPYNMVLDTMRSGKVEINNLEIENGVLKGSNGSIDRYGTVGKTQSLVILKEKHDKNGNFVGYFCSDSMGHTKDISESEAISFAEKLGIANGKVVTNEQSVKHISSIRGTYKVEVDTSSKPMQINQQNQQQNQSNNQPDYYNDAMIIINKVDADQKLKSKMSKEFASKVITYVKSYKKCSVKQYNILKSTYDKLVAPKQEKVVPKVEEPNKVETEKKPENKSKSLSFSNLLMDDIKPNLTTPEQPKNIVEPQKSVVEQPSSIIETETSEMDPPNVPTPTKSMDELLEYVIMDGVNAYVKKINSIEYNGSIIIPEVTTIDEKQYKVTGIASSAFAYSNISRVKTSRFINDIGQSAFSGCHFLVAADLSESKHTHLAMRLFYDCKHLISVSVGSKVQRIHESAFELCTKLEKIELPTFTDTVARNAFYGCESLSSIKHSLRLIQDSAFRNCIRLKEFDFTPVNSIGAYAFRGTGFENLVIPGNVTVIGNKAFADCNILKEVHIEDGVQELGEYCFAKATKNEYISRNRLLGKNIDYETLSDVYMPKSVNIIKFGAFRNVELVHVYAGSHSESYCIEYNIDHDIIDQVSLDNSTRIRVKSMAVGSNPIESIYNALQFRGDGASDIEDYVIKEDKLVDIALSDELLSLLKIDKVDEDKAVEPCVKFKAAVNYLQDISNIYKTPLSKPVLRVSSIYDISNTILFDDGCNKICKIAYTVKDTLEEGICNIVVMNNHLRYITENYSCTDLDMNSYSATDEQIPIDKYLHVGDTLAWRVGASNGKEMTLEVDGMKIDVGNQLYERIYNHCIFIKMSSKETYMYVPVCDKAIKRTEDTVTKICSYNEMLEELKKLKNKGVNSKLFDNLCGMSDATAKRRIHSLQTIDDEKEAHLFMISKQFRFFVDSKGIKKENITPNLLTYELFNELSVSYWMVKKDIAWLNATGSRALNKNNEYTIGKYKVIEYKSNQIVKFSNPYMNGKKGAYVFKLTNGVNTIGVYASRYDLEDLVKMLYNLTDLSKYDGTEIPVLMQDANNLDMVDPRLFYKFFNVLDTSKSMSFSDIVRNYGYCYRYAISLYKPTGIFYLVMYRYRREQTYIRRKVVLNEIGIGCIPIFPIGNMDRALVVAETTNHDIRESKFKDELKEVAMQEEILNGSRVLGLSNIANNSKLTLGKYLEARRLIINRDKDISKYLKLMDSRAVYMLGTVHVGELKRDNPCGSSVYDEEEEEDLYSDLYEEEVDQYDEEDDTEDEDIYGEEELGEEAEEEYEEDEPDDIYSIDEEEEDEESGEDISKLTEAQFKEMLKASGVDVSSNDMVHAMYLSFLSDSGKGV